MVMFIIVVYLAILIFSIVLPLYLNKIQALMPSEILLYWGSIITFIGTTSLGLLTLYLNKKKEKSDEKAYLLSIKPYIDISFIGGSYNNIEVSEMRYRFNNVSANPALCLKICKYILYNKNNEYIKAVNINYTLTNCLNTGAYIDYSINNIKNFTIDSFIEIYICYEDKLKNKEEKKFKFKKTVNSFINIKYD